MSLSVFACSHTFNRIDDYIFANDTIELRCPPPRSIEMRSFPIGRVSVCVRALVNRMGNGEHSPYNNSHFRIPFSLPNKTHTSADTNPCMSSEIADMHSCRLAVLTRTMNNKISTGIYESEKKEKKKIQNRVHCVRLCVCPVP